ncbi:MAG: hypothetical protein ABTQ28_07350, partial [Thauera sp.]
MAPNTRIRLIPLLLLCMSGASAAGSMSPLQVAPELLRGPPAVVPASPAGRPPQARPLAVAEPEVTPAAATA